MLVILPLDAFPRLPVFEYGVGVILLHAHKAHPVGAKGGQKASGRTGDEGKLRSPVLAPAKGDFRHGIFPGQIVHGFPIVLIKGKGPVPTAVDADVQDAGQGDAAQSAFLRSRQRNDAAGLHQHGHFRQGTKQLRHFVSPVHPPGEKVEIKARREPGLHPRPHQGRIHRRGDGADDHFAAKMVLVGDLIGLLPLGMGVIHRGYQLHAPGVAEPVDGVQIGQEPVPQPQKIRHDPTGLGGIPPGLFAVEQVAGAVHAHDGGEHPKLQPADLQFIIPAAMGMPPDVMAPPAIADVGGRGCEIRLKGQGRPTDYAVPGKSHRVAVAAWPRIAGKDQRTLSFPADILCMIMIQHPQRVQAVQGGGAALLPVHPPKIHPFPFPGMVQIRKISLPESTVPQVKRNPLPAGSVLAQGQGHPLIHFFMRLHALGRMQIQGHLEPAVMQSLQKGFGLGKQLPVPGVASPALSPILRLGHMPVHVQHRNAQGDSVTLKPVHQSQVFPVPVGVEPAPPIPQGIPGQQRRGPAQMKKVLQGLLVGIAIAEKVPILNAGPAGLHPTILGQHKGPAVIQRGKPLQARQKPGLQRAGAVHLVQSAGCAPQVFGEGIPKAPRTINAPAFASVFRP